MFKKIFAIILIAVLIGGGFYLVKKYWAPKNEAQKAAEAEAEKKAEESAVRQEAQTQWSAKIEEAVKTDKDLDGLTDDEEAKLGTNPNSVDTDADGLMDKTEVETYKTDPKNPDTDKDGFKDGYEVRRGYNPNGAGKL